MKTGSSRFPQAGVLWLDFRYRSNANDGNELPRTSSQYLSTRAEGCDSLRDIFSLNLLPLIFSSLILFLHCRYHAGVANNRFIGCLVGLLLLLFIVSFASRLPTRSNPTIDEKKFGNTLRVSEFFGGKSGIRTHDALPHT